MNGSSASFNCAPSKPRWVGLPVTVVPLRIDGRRLTAQEFRESAGITGRLILRPTDKFQSASGATHLAELARPSAADSGFQCKPIFNPTIEQIDHRGFVLSGYEISAVDGTVRYIEQVWLVRPSFAQQP